MSLHAQFLPHKGLLNPARLSIPVFHAQHISRVAALSKKEQAEKSAELEEQKSTWGFNKRLARAKREKRKVLW